MRTARPIAEPAPPPGGRGIWWSLLPPLVALVAVNALLLGAAAVDGFDYFSSSAWIRWDSFHYIEIAERGYTLTPCVQVELFDPATVIDAIGSLFGAEPAARCGNAGWFPGYPGAIRGLEMIGVPTQIGAVLIATVAHAALLLAIWVWFLRDRPRTSALLALGAASFFLGHVYLRAAFPMSVTLLLVLLHVRALTRERWLAAGLWGGLAAFTYPLGVLLAPVAVAWLIAMRWGPKLAGVVRPAALVATLTASGFGAVLLVHRLTTGAWLAFFDIQGRFNYGVHLPTTRLARIIRPLFEDGLSLETVPSLHSVVAAILVLGLVGAALQRWASLEAIEKWALLYVTIFWLFPLMLNGQASLYRIEVLLLPGVLLMPRLPRAFQAASVFTLVALAGPMALLFFRNVLI